MQARRRELDHYVAMAIEEAITRSSERVDPTVGDETPPESAFLESRGDPEARALEEATSMLVHELQLVVGRVRLAAERGSRIERTVIPRSYWSGWRISSMPSTRSARLRGQGKRFHSISQRRLRTSWPSLRIAAR